MCIHAIGDRANREVLNIYEETFKRNNRNGRDLRWRIEHAQHINRRRHPALRPARRHCVDAGRPLHVRRALGDAASRRARAEEGAYVWQKLMKSGAVVTNGTDAPVEDVDPIASYYATVTRKAADGKVFYGDQRMSRMEALRSYTLSNAFAAFEEDLKGIAQPSASSPTSPCSRKTSRRSPTIRSRPRRSRTRSSAAGWFTR